MKRERAEIRYPPLVSSTPQSLHVRVPVTGSIITAEEPATVLLMWRPASNAVDVEAYVASGVNGHTVAIDTEALRMELTTAPGEWVYVPYEGNFNQVPGQFSLLRAASGTIRVTARANSHPTTIFGNATVGAVARPQLGRFSADGMTVVSSAMLISATAVPARIICQAMPEVTIDMGEDAQVTLFPGGGRYDKVAKHLPFTYDEVVPIGVSGFTVISQYSLAAQPGVQMAGLDVSEDDVNYVRIRTVYPTEAIELQLNVTLAESDIVAFAQMWVYSIYAATPISGVAKTKTVILEAVHIYEYPTGVRTYQVPQEPGMQLFALVVGITGKAVGEDAALRYPMINAVVRRSLTTASECPAHCIIYEDLVHQAEVHWDGSVDMDGRIGGEQLSLLPHVRPSENGPFGDWYVNSA